MRDRRQNELRDSVKKEQGELTESVHWRKREREGEFCCEVKLMELCRFGTMCWRALCPYVHACSRTRARKCAETWRLLSEMEEEESLVEIPQVQHIVVDGPVVQTVQDRLQFLDKIVDMPVAEPFEMVVDVPVVQTVQVPHEQIVEKLIKTPPQLQIVEQIAVFTEFPTIQTIHSTQT